MTWNDKYSRLGCKSARHPLQKINGCLLKAIAVMMDENQWIQTIWNWILYICLCFSNDSTVETLTFNARITWLSNFSSHYLWPTLFLSAIIQRLKAGFHGPTVLALSASLFSRFRPEKGMPLFSHPFPSQHRKSIVKTHSKCICLAPECIFIAINDPMHSHCKAGAKASFSFQSTENNSYFVRGGVQCTCPS